MKNRHGYTSEGLLVLEDTQSQPVMSRESRYEPLVSDLGHTAGEAPSDVS